MTCTEFERLLDQREPDAQTEAALQRHAEECAHCRMLLELRSLDRDEQVPEEVSTRWKAALRTEQAKAESTRRSRGFFQARVLAPLCAVAAVLIAAVALRNPITEVKQAKAPMMTMQAAQATPSENRETAAPYVPEAEPESGALAMPVALSTAMPTLRANAAVTSEPVPALGLMQENSLFSDTESVEEVTVPEEELDYDEGIWDIDESWEIPMEESLMEATDEAPMLVEAYDSVAMTDEEIDPMILSWTAEHPQKAAEQLLAALGRTGETAEPEEDGSGASGSVVLTMTVGHDEWPAFLAALAEVGYEDTASLEDHPFDLSDSVELVLHIKAKEK